MDEERNFTIEPEDEPPAQSEYTQPDYIPEWTQPTQPEEPEEAKKKRRTWLKITALLLALVGKPVALMNKDDKVKAIRFLNQNGAFLVTKSGDKIAKYFGISKYTLYSYIDSKQEEKAT